MLTVYRSNRAEWLSALLSEQLRVSPPEPFKTVDIIVNTWPTSRWLSEQIASVNGISAQINFPFPNAHLAKLVQLYLGQEESDVDSWKANQLIWTIIDVLPELLEKKEAQTLININTKEKLSQRKINKQIWEIANDLTNTIDEYIFYRPKTIKSWWESRERHNQRKKEGSAEEQWQAMLITLLKERIKTKPICLQIIDVINKLKRNVAPQNEMPDEIIIFGVSSLAPIQIDLLQALSSIMEIKVFLLTPCKDLWMRSKDRRINLGYNLEIPTDGSWLLNSPRLEANFGRMGAEFQQLLEGSGEYQLGLWNEEDLFSMPAKIATNDSRVPTLLEQLQESLVKKDSEIKLCRQACDNSLLFIASPGQKRQIQIIRDQIIQLLAQDCELQPRDILIMTPQISQLAPLITSVFNDVSSTKVKLPWRITDRTQIEKPGLIQFMIDLIDLSSNKLTPLELIRLLSNDVIQKEFNYEQEEIDKLMNCLQSSGFHWGVDKTDRNGEATNSLDWCLERWLLGIILPDTPGLAPQGIAPFSGSFSVHEITKWWVLLSKLKTHLQALRVSRSCKDWCVLLFSILNDLFSVDNNMTWEHESFLSHIKRWQSHAGNCKLKIETPVLSDILKKYISLESGRFGHRSGKITFSALEPMRAIPHKVIILMGLDNSIFPHSENRSSYSLLEHYRFLGDPRSTDKDRYVLLEAIMSTRNKLLISWNARNEKTGESLEPATPIHQWIEYLRNELDDESFNGIIKTPPSNPLSFDNFISNKKSRILSCDHRDLEARLYLDNELNPKSSALALPLNWEKNFKPNANSIEINIELIRKWLTAPQLTWLEQLDIKPKLLRPKILNTEIYELSELERYSLLKEKYKELENASFNTNNQNLYKFPRSIYWQSKVKGQGILPPKSAAKIECELLESRWTSILNIFKNMGQARNYLLEIENERMNITLLNEDVLTFEIGQIKLKSILSTWLKHLYVCAYDIHPRRTIIISRAESIKSANKYYKSLEFNSISKEEAMNLISRLKLLVKQGTITCWPVPPQSGWEFYRAKYYNKTKFKSIFKNSWEGSYKRSGERSKEEMKICFGEECDSMTFLDNSIIESCLLELYDPILKNIIT